MTPKRILLTGDDGYNSIGIRLLIHALKDDFELAFAATKHQQSGVGGKLTFGDDTKWGEVTVDGVAGIWVDGAPADAVGCAHGYFDQPFDLIISGINLGINASSAIVSSGTFSAAIRGLGIKLAPRALVLSWECPPDLWSMAHDGNHDLTSYQDYPGKILKPLFKKIFAENMWGAPILNINFPEKPSHKIRFTKILKDLTKVFTHPIIVDRQTHRYSYLVKKILDLKEDNLRYDAGAIKHGYISITPCVFDMTHFTIFEKLEHEELEL
jgi:5'-nucleotidase